MNGLNHVFVRLYKLALRLYPSAVQTEYGDEMVIVFEETCREAAGISFWSSVVVGFIEFRDLPGNLIREHWANYHGKFMNNQPGPSISLPKSALRGALGFGVSFFLIDLAYCFIDVLFNYGKIVGPHNSVWNALYIHPTALASGIGAVVIGTGISRRRVVLSAITCFLCYTLVAIWGSFFLSKSLFSDNPFIFMAIAGVFVGGGIGIFQRDWKRAGLFTLAGMLGFILGWFVDRAISANILIHYPIYVSVFHLEIGSLVYFIYMVVPSLFYGLVVGFCLGMAAYRKVKIPILTS